MNDVSVCTCEACTCDVPNDGDRCSETCRDCDETAEVCMCNHADCAGGEVEEELFDETIVGDDDLEDDEEEAGEE